MRSLEERVQELEDIEEISRLKTRYARLCDANYDPDGLASLFTVDGLWDDGGNLGIYQGREVIRAFFAGISKRVTFALHYVIGHRIDVAPGGDEATGMWYLLAPMTRDGRAVWSALTYSDRYRKVNGHWLFSYVKIGRAFVTPVESGWVKERFLS